MTEKAVRIMIRDFGIATVMIQIIIRLGLLREQINTIILLSLIILMKKRLRSISL